MQTNTTVSIPVEVKVKAQAHGIGFSQTLTEALTQKIADLEGRAELAGRPVAPGPTTAINEGAT